MVQISTRLNENKLFPHIFFILAVHLKKMVWAKMKVNIKFQKDRKGNIIFFLTHFITHLENYIPTTINSFKIYDDNIIAHKRCYFNINNPKKNKAIGYVPKTGVNL